MFICFRSPARSALAHVVMVIGWLSFMTATACSADYTVHIIDPPVNNRPIVPDQPLPPTCKPGHAFAITACRGEYEPVSFVIETPRLLQKVDVKVSALKGAGGEIDVDAVDVRVVAPVFRRITDWPGTVNWLLVHDPDLVLITDEPRPDALKEGASAIIQAYIKSTVFTRRPVDTTALQPADVESRQQFWLTVHVPDNAAAGVYRSLITIVADNADPRKLTLELTVPDFELEPPRAGYSVYHPVWLEGGHKSVHNPMGYVVLSEQQYLNDLRNMVAHGCLNPTFNVAPTSTPDGDLDFTRFTRFLDLRDQAGIPRSLPLYANGAGRVNTSQKITAEQKIVNTRQIRQFVDWLDKRGGYGDLYMMGADEATGQALMDQRDAWQSIRDGGGKIFVAHYAGYTEGIGDLLNLPIMLHPMHYQLDSLSLMPAEQFLQFPAEVRSAVDLKRVFAPAFQKTLQTVHDHGYRIYTYMDPLAGYTLPEVHRRMRGLVMWKSGIDGTMTWSYANHTNSQFTTAGPFEFSIFSFVVRGLEAPFDSLSWEAYREGYDDARYMATLEAAMIAARGSDGSLVSETARWLSNVDVVHGDLDAIRIEMIRRITALRASGK